MVHLADDVRNPHRPLLGQAHVDVREPSEEVVQDETGDELHRGAVPPVHDVLERVEVAERVVGVLGPVGAVLLVVGAAQVHRELHSGFVDP